MRHWEMLYRRPPWSMDVCVFAVALMLHAPLVFFHMKAPHARKRGTTIQIDMVEKMIEQKKEKAVTLPPKPPSVTKVAEDIKKKMQEAVKPPPPPPPVLPKLNIPEPPKLAAPKLTAPAPLPATRSLPPVALPKLSDRGSLAQAPTALAGSRLGDLKAAQGATLAAQGKTFSSVNTGPVISGREGFAVKQDSLAGIGGGAEIKLGGGPVLVMPTAKTSREDQRVFAPAGSVDRGSLASAPASGGLKGAGAAAPSLAIPTGGRAQPVAAAPLVKSEKVFSSPTLVDAGSVGGLPGGSGSALPELPRKPARPAKPLFSIVGPLENRGVLYKQLPEFPDWALARGMDASVVLKFTVSPDGGVKGDSLSTVRTSGDPRLDRLAMDALKGWRFEPLPPDRSEDQTGQITMNFTVR